MACSFHDYAEGYLKIQYTGEETARFVNLCRNHQINIWNVQCQDQMVSLYCGVKEFKKLVRIQKKCHGRIRIAERRGLYFYFKSKKKHVCYLVGIGVFFILGKILSLYIWNISFEGNYSNTNVELTKFLESNAYSYGMKKSEVDCGKLEYLLRTNYPDITWVSVEINGTKLLVHMKENFDGYHENVESGSSHLIATDAGIVTGIVTRTGVPMVKTGDIIEQGQILISGILDNYGDNDTFVSRSFVQADGDVFANVEIPYNHQFSMEYVTKQYTGNQHTIGTLRILQRTLYFSLPYEPYPEADMIASEKQLCLLHDFYFPLYHGKMIVKEYHTQTLKYTKEEAHEIATENLERFVKKLEEKGIQIIEKNVTIENNDEVCIASGHILVNQKIGAVSAIDETKHAKNPLEEPEE